MTSSQLTALVRSAGYRGTTFENAADLMDSHRLQPPCCVLLDLDPTKADGCDLQSEISRRFEFMPVIVLSGQRSLDVAVATMKSGAVDYLVKPVDPGTIINAINAALAKQARFANFSLCSARFHQGLQKLTSREREVLSFITDGFLNKQIAAELGISEKTIKVHRGRVMKKMQVSSFAELVRITERASILEHLSHESRHESPKPERLPALEAAIGFKGQPPQPFR